MQMRTQMFKAIELVEAVALSQPSVDARLIIAHDILVNVLRANEPIFVDEPKTADIVPISIKEPVS